MMRLFLYFFLVVPRASKTLPRQRPAFIGAASVGDRSNLHAGDTKDAGLERITETWVHLQRKQEQLKQPLEKVSAMVLWDLFFGCTVS